MYQHIFESHCHYDDPRFNPDRETLLPGLHQSGIEFMMHASNNLESAHWGVRAAGRYPFLYTSVGIHPHEAAGLAPDYLEKLEALALANPKVRAIGEIGLDYHYDFAPRETQQKAFSEQLALAGRLGLPVIIHSREATADTLSLIRRHKPRGVIHCYSGSAETAREVMATGLDISFGFTGVITFKGAHKTMAAAAAIPAQRLLIETDCPYMAPAPYRGGRCDSGMLSPIAEKLADIKGLEPQGLVSITCANACRLFGIPLPSGLYIHIV